MADSALSFSNFPPALSDAPTMKTAAAPTSEKAPEQKPAQKPALPAAYSALGQGTRSAQKEVDALEASKMQLKPPSINLPPKPQPQHTSPIEQWGSYAMLFAALGGMLSRNHLTTALNAAAAVLDGFKKNDIQASDRAFKTWDAENKNALRLIGFQNHAYEQAIGDITKRESLAYKKGSEEDRVAEARVKALLHAFGDVAGLTAFEHGGMAEFENHLKRSKEAAEELKDKHSEAGAQGGEFIARRLLMETPEYKDADPMKKREMVLKNYKDFHPGKVVGDPGTTDAPTPQVVNLAEKMKAYDVDPPNGWQMKNDPEAAAAFRLARQDENYRPAEAKIIAQGKKDLQDGKAGTTLRSLAAVQDHLDYLSILARGLPTGSNVQKANEWAAAMSKQYGKPNVTTFEAARAIVAPEIIKAIVNGQGGVEERKDAQNLLHPGMADAQIQDAIGAVRALLGAQADKIVTSQFRNMPPEIMNRFVDMKVIEGYRQAMLDAKAKAKTFARPEKTKTGTAAPLTKTEAAPVEISGTKESLLNALDETKVPDGTRIKTEHGSGRMNSSVRKQIREMLGQ